MRELDLLYHSSQRSNQDYLAENEWRKKREKILGDELATLVGDGWMVSLSQERKAGRLADNCLWFLIGASWVDGSA